MTQKLVFIAGLTHSGSTILNLLLSSHPKLIGIGEVIPLITHSTYKLDEPDRMCSCGALIRDCVFWGPFRERMRAEGEMSAIARYQQLVRHFSDVFGPDMIPVDSSKSFRALGIVLNVPEVSVKVLHLIRDVRSWTVSRLDNDRRKGYYRLSDLWAKQGWNAWRPFLQRNPYARFLIWHYGNRRIQEMLQRKHAEPLRISYENIGLNTEEAARRIFQYLEIDSPAAGGLIESSSEGALRTTSDHIALGNRMRLDQERRRAIRYDAKWLSRREWLLPSALLRPVMRYNQQAVYETSDAGERRPTTASA